MGITHIDQYDGPVAVIRPMYGRAFSTILVVRGEAHLRFDETYGGERVLDAAQCYTLSAHLGGGGPVGFEPRASGVAAEGCATRPDDGCLEQLEAIAGPAGDHVPAERIREDLTVEIGERGIIVRGEGIRLELPPCAGEDDRRVLASGLLKAARAIDRQVTGAGFAF